MFTMHVQGVSMDGYVMCWACEKLGF